MRPPRTRTRPFRRRAKPSRERLRLPHMDPAPERERASSQWLAHACGESIDLAHFSAHRWQVTTAPQRGREDDKIVVVTQFCFQSFQLGNERRDAHRQAPREAKLIPERFHFFAPAVQRRGLPRLLGPFHRVTALTIRCGEDRDHAGPINGRGCPLFCRLACLLQVPGCFGDCSVVLRTGLAFIADCDQAAADNPVGVLGELSWVAATNAIERVDNRSAVAEPRERPGRRLQALAIPARQLRARLCQERRDRPHLLDGLTRFMDGAPELGAFARRESMDRVSELPAHNLRELIFNVFPVV